jgi:hypothetical protein
MPYPNGIMRLHHTILMTGMLGRFLLNHPHKIILKEAWWEGEDWIYVALDSDWCQALVNTNDPLSSIKGREFLGHALASQERL